MPRLSKTDYQFIVFALFILTIGITTKTMNQKPKPKVQSTYIPKEYTGKDLNKWQREMNISLLVNKLIN